MFEYLNTIFVNEVTMYFTLFVSSCFMTYILYTYCWIPNYDCEYDNIIEYPAPYFNNITENKFIPTIVMYYYPTNINSNNALAIWKEMQDYIETNLLDIMVTKIINKHAENTYTHPVVVLFKKNNTIVFDTVITYDNLVKFIYANI